MKTCAAECGCILPLKLSNKKKFSVRFAGEPATSKRSSTLFLLILQGNRPHYLLEKCFEISNLFHGLTGKTRGTVVQVPWKPSHPSERGHRKPRMGHYNQSFMEKNFENLFEGGKNKKFIKTSQLLEISPGMLRPPPFTGTGQAHPHPRAIVTTAGRSVACRGHLKVL